MNSDSIYFIGTGHLVCQDYSISGEINGWRFAIISDGCSMADNSDIGARLLTRAVECYLKSYTQEYPIDQVLDESIFLSLITDAVRFAEENNDWMMLGKNALDATLGIVLANSQYVYAALWGDGAVIFGHRDNYLDCWSVEYQKSYPYYPSYQLSRERRNSWCGLEGNHKIVTNYIIDKNKDDVTREEKTSQESLEFFSAPIDDYRFVSVMSDGIHTFAGSEGLPFEEIAIKLTDYKQPKGDFVKRTTKWWKNELMKSNISHHDDFSVGTVWLKSISSETPEAIKL